MRACLDFFAGSGTTGHAVINLNREDGGKRKFILVETASYFETVLLPRLKKIIFTPEMEEMANLFAWRQRKNLNVVRKS